MTRVLIAALTALGLARAPDAAALRQTAPAYLTVETAQLHLAAAQLAADAYGVPEELLLSVAWHESRYEPGTRTREPGARWSCGVMTPEPHRGACSPAELTTLCGYLAGARHLRVWLDVCRGDETCALRGYAGGYALLRACRDSGYYVRDGVDACDVGKMFTHRAALIRSRMEHARKRGTS